MSISKYIAPIGSIYDLLKVLLTDEFTIPIEIATEIALKTKSHFDCLLGSLFVLAETNYVDKV